MPEVPSILIIIPCYNEGFFVSYFLESLFSQVYSGKVSIIVVDDNSNDNSYDILTRFQKPYKNLSVIKSLSNSKNHQPGSKIISAFYKGLEYYKKKYDIICKFDADIILPKNYLELIAKEFLKNPRAGIVSGHLYIKDNDKWVYENISNKDATRGPIKAYRKKCFQQIGGLKSSIGWDTIDEMLARYYGWDVVTIPELHVKHLKPTGASYNSKAKYLQGEAFFKMRYGWWLTFITAAKMAWNKKNFKLIPDYLKGYKLAQKKNLEPLVTVDQGDFIRAYRWNGIKSKLGF